MAKTSDIYLDNGVWTFRASALGGCIRGLVAARMGIAAQPPKAWLQTRLDESSVAEKLVINRLVKKGWKVSGEQSKLELLVPEGRIRGHIDGYVESPDGIKYLLEIKALGPDLFRKYVRGGLKAMGAPFDRMYGMQYSFYGLASQLAVMLAVYQKGEENPDTGQILESFWEQMPYTLQDLRDRMSEINQRAQQEDWPECDGKCGPHSWYWHVHEENPVVRVSDEDIEAKVEKFRQLKKTIGVLEDERDKLGAELKKELGRGSHSVGPWKVTISHGQQTRTDLDRLRRDHGDEFMAAYAYEVPQVRMTISEKKGKKDA